MKFLSVLTVAKKNQLFHSSKYLSTAIDKTTITRKDGLIGFIGLGSMGSKMIANLHRDGKEIMIYDKSKVAVQNILNTYKTGVSEGDLISIANNCSTVISILPNDSVVTLVSEALIRNSKHHIVHISCSTISPTTSRKLDEMFRKNNKTFIAAPVFARPDGLAKRQATWMIAGESKGKIIATELLSSMGNVVDFGDDVGASNVVKLCGNFLIASSIESIAEAMTLAEKHGVDQVKVMNLLSSTIFDCLIYKGYGDRVSKRDHRAGGFSLELGLKDVTLVSQAAREGGVPMPFLSILVDRFTSAKAKGRANFDWSAIGLSVAEDAGINVLNEIKRNKKDIKDGNTY